MQTKEQAATAWKARFQNRSVKDVPALGNLTVRNAKSATAEICLYDEIGFWGVTAGQFKDQLDGVTAKNITLHINSPGGDVFDGLAIYNALKAHSATVNCVIDGVAASAASYIAMAGDTITMGTGTFMMIHKATGICLGNDTDMVATANVLTKIDGQIAAIYAARTGAPVADMLTAMAAESWYTAEEAVAAKLADQVSGANSDDAASNAARDTFNAMRRRLQLATVD